MLFPLFHLNRSAPRWRSSGRADDVCLGNGDEREPFFRDDVDGYGARPKVLPDHACVDGVRRERVDDHAQPLRVHAGARGAQLSAARHLLPSARLR